jgi:hypothetical protein
LLHEWPLESVIVFSKLWNGLFCVFASLCLSLSCFLVVNATKILGFLTQGKEGLSPYMISTNPHSPHDKPFKSQRGLKKDPSHIHKTLTGRCSISKNTYALGYHVSSRTILAREHSRVAWSFMCRVKPW